MKHAKRLLSMLLLASMLLSMLPAVALTASAAYEGTGTFNLCTDATIASGYYVFGFQSGTTLYAVKNAANGNKWVDRFQTTGGTAIENPDASIVWYFDANAGTLYNEAAKGYLYGDSSNAAYVGATQDVHTFTQNGSTYTLKNTTRNRTLVSASGSSYKYRYYSSVPNGGKDNLTIYKLDELSIGTTYTVTYNLNGKTGVTGELPTGQTVREGGEYTVLQPELTLYGYKLIGWNTDKGATEGLSTVKNVTANVTLYAIWKEKEKSMVSFNVGADAVTDYVGEIIALPAFAGAEPEGYKFVGWAEQTVDETTNKPEFLAAGATYTMPETDKTLYALFTHTEGGTGEAVWTLVEDAGTLKAGDKLVIASNTKDKTAGNINSNHMTVVTTTFSEDKKTITKLGSGTVELTLGGKKDNWTLANSDGKLLGATAAKSVAWDKGTTTWNITIENGGNEAIIQNTPSDFGRFLHNVKSSWFSTYTSKSNTSMLLPQLYRQTVSGTTYYTTSPDTTTYTLTGIKITTPAKKTTFVVNEEFSSEGLGVTATYVSEDGSKTQEKTVTGFTVSAPDMTTAGTKTVTVSYTEGETTKTATYEITVKAAYTLTYDKNTTDDVTGLPENVTGLEENTEYSLSPATPVRANYNFLGWAMSEDSNEKVTTVTMTGNQTVYAIWQEKTKYTVSFYAKQGAEPTKKEYHDGDTIAAADVPAIDPIEGYTFKGWYGATYNNAAAPAYVTPAGTKVTADRSFYAVYAETSSTGGNTEYTLTDVSKIGANDSVVVTILKDGTYYALPTADATNSGPLAKSTVTVSGDKITSTVDATITWKIDYNETDKTFTLSTEADNTKKLNLTSNNNGVRVSKNSSTFTVAENEYLSGKDTSNTVRYIGIYNTEDWRCYKEINTNIAGQTLGFYVKAGEIISGYTTNPVVANSHDVTWYNEDGTTVFATTTVKEGRTITEPTGTPSKAADGEHWYEFSGWAKTPNGEVVTEYGTMATEEQSFYAVFTAKEYTLTATITGSAITAVGETLQLSAKLTFEPAGADVTGYTLAWSSDSETITVDADGKVSATDAGTATITATFTKGSSTVTATFEIQAVAEPAFTLVTPRNAPTDWSGEYVIAGRYHNVDTYANTYAIFSAEFESEIPDGKSRKEAGSNAVALGDTGIKLFADGTELAKDGNGSVHQYNDEDLVLANKMINVSDDYIWVVECVDDINQYYTIKERKYDIYLAAEEGSSTNKDANSIGFALSGDGNLALWQFEKWVVKYDDTNTNENGAAYTNEIIVIRNVGEGNRLFAFNTYPRQTSKKTEIGDGWFRTYLYASEWEGVTGMSGNADNLGDIKGAYPTAPDQVFNVYLFSNPHPYKAQIYYLGNQVTIASPATVPSGAASAKLMSAIVPEIEDNSGWVQVGAPVWSIVEQSSGAAMSIDATTGVLSTNGAAAGSYALVQVTYVLRDTASNAEHTVTTQAKAVIGETASYTHVIYENKSGMGTEVQYNVYKNANQTAGCTLPLGVYVVNNLTGASSKDGAVTVGGTAAWSVTNTTDATQTATISADGTLDYSGITKNSILLVTVNGLTGAAGEGAATAAKAGTFKVYVRVVSYTAEITHDNGTTGDFAAPFGATSIVLDKLVKNADGNTAGAETFTLTETSAYQWEASHGTITKNTDGTATLDVSGLEAGTVITVKVSGLEAKVGDAVTEVPHATVRVTVGDRPQNVTAENITVVIDYDRKVTIDLSDKFTVTNTELDTITLSDGAAAAGFALAQVDDKWTVTFTPQGILREAKSCTYTVTAKDGSQAAGTITVKPASAVYYEDDNSAFTFTDGKHGKWTTATDGATIDAQTSSLLSEDIIGYDENYDVKTYAKYSAGSVHYVNVTEDELADTTAAEKNPTVEFDFAGTGFDVISVTSNNTGAFLIDVTNTEGKSVYSKLLSTYRGYEYVPDGYVRTDYIPVIRCDENGTEDPAGQYSKTVTGTGENDFTVRFEPDGFFVKTTDGYKPEGEGESIDQKWYVKREMTTQWRPVDDGENLDYYQIPVIRKLGLPYGVYHVKITAAYSRVFDVKQDGEYNFYFDAVRIYDPIPGGTTHHYVSLRDAIIAAGTFGVTKIEPCEHDNDEDNAQWGVLQPATYSDNPTLNGRGMMVKLCGKCGNAIDYAYFYVKIQAESYNLITDGDPSSTMLSYTITLESDAPEELKETFEGIVDELQDIRLGDDEQQYLRWRSADENVLTCVAETACGRGEGETYVTFDLLGGYLASGIRSDPIKVTGPDTYLIKYVMHVEDVKDKDKVADRLLGAQVVPINGSCKLLDPTTMRRYNYILQRNHYFHTNTFVGWSENVVAPESFVQEEPSHHTLAESFTTDKDITLYSLFHIEGVKNTYERTMEPLVGGKRIIFQRTASGIYPLAHPERINEKYGLPINEGMDTWLVEQVTIDGTTGVALKSSYGKYFQFSEDGRSYVENAEDAMMQFVPNEEQNAFYLYSVKNKKWFSWNEFGVITSADSQKDATPLSVWVKGDGREIQSYATVFHELVGSYSYSKKLSSCWDYDLYVCWCGHGETNIYTSDAHTFAFDKNTCKSLNETQHSVRCIYCGKESVENHTFENDVCTKCQYQQAGAGTAAAEVTPYAVSGGNVTGGAGAADTGATGGDASPGNPGNTGGTDTGSTGNAVNTIIGSGIIDGKGKLFDVGDFEKHGPKTEVYLAQNQAVVFYLEGGDAKTDVQLGAKAVNGSAAGLTVITLTGNTSGAVKTIENKQLVTATEMYYEIGGDLVWSNGTSCVVIVMNTGEGGVLALTNIRSTAKLDVVMNREATESGAAVLQRIAAGTMVYGPDDFITIVDSSKLPASPDPVNPDPVKPDPVNPKPEPVKPDPVNPDPVDPKPGDPSEPKPSDPKPSDPKPETPSVTDFADLDKDAWYYDGVRYAVEAGLMNGTGAKTFEPDGKLTRAMLVTILYRLAGAPEVTATTKFTDVPADAWYAKAVAWAAGQKITNGTTDTTFDPNGNVTREQMVTFLWRYAGEPKAEGKLDAFPDAAKVSAYAQTAFAWAVENGVVKGDLVGTTSYLAPQGEATRAQIAAIFMRSEKLLAKD